MQVDEPEARPLGEPEPGSLGPIAGTVTVEAGTVDRMVAKTVSWTVVGAAVFGAVTVRMTTDGSDPDACSVPVVQVVLRSLYRDTVLVGDRWWRREVKLTVERL